MTHIIRMRGDEAIKYVSDNLPLWASGNEPTERDALMMAHGITAIALRQMIAVEIQLRMRMLAQGFDTENVEEEVRMVSSAEYADILARKRACDG